ncbi:AbrB/MazE/SpoVT family DNA-binding domain-containing protein [Candidatus Woesearchaeota archaeon]|nr:AbrB/MazE/SpoVT family DNA-binding domain-containing protein [Candidatus Woesearchaeota archaeon]
MKRKVNRVGTNTLTVSLPSRWAKQFGVEVGDEIELIEDGGSLKICKFCNNKKKSIELDVSDLDRTSVMLKIRSAYRCGYDEITVNFRNSKTMHHRKKKEINVIDAIHQEVNKRLLGVEIVEESNNYCLIKDFSASDVSDLENSVRRIFRLIINLSNEILENVSSGEFDKLEIVENNHDTITKFVSYCLRLLIKDSSFSKEERVIKYHIIASLDNVVDIMKYFSRDVIRSKNKSSKEFIKAIELVNSELKLYYEFFYSQNNEIAYKFNEIREEVKEHLLIKHKKMKPEEILYSNYYRQIIDILWDLLLAKFI